MARNEVGMVRYQHNLLGTRGPRKMTVVIPRLDSHGRVLPMPESDGSMTERSAPKPIHAESCS